jgi:hypothetical protein
VTRDPGEVAKKSTRKRERQLDKKAVERQQENE